MEMISNGVNKKPASKLLRACQTQGWWVGNGATSAALMTKHPAIIAGV
ncbi:MULTISPECIES: hypothetical protein [unclassified Undibacterium]|nr:MULTISPECIES: hypothetical protein [unclassified Undibacterium]MEB0138626.1 hypothetical protein [Undibacterium sp. CCC2.1]MEB0171427.1 hypothetical protein [Undibacterium sp. CCC1.1]MEB0175757.1 hypothetical protein [Undibacterium sp. CCC3.4]MEB0214415.1 hypothetical protein [Undibacterium sp. 5I2]WPX44280.1 hypothetical protein RHM61_03355 [Undibacterium sp. CCC3.4]